MEGPKRRSTIILTAQPSGRSGMARRMIGAICFHAARTSPQVSKRLGRTRTMCTFLYGSPPADTLSGVATDRSAHSSAPGSAPVRPERGRALRQPRPRCRGDGLWRCGRTDRRSLRPAVTASAALVACHSAVRRSGFPCSPPPLARGSVLRRKERRVRRGLGLSSAAV